MGTLNALGIDKELYEMSSRAVSMDQAHLKRFKQMTACIELQENTRLMGEGYTPMTREVAIERIKKIEDKKSQFIAGIMIMAEIGKYPKDKIQFGTEMAKFQAIDQMYDTLGIQESDIAIAMQKYNLLQDPEFADFMKGQKENIKMRFEKGLKEIADKAKANQQQDDASEDDDASDDDDDDDDDASEDDQQQEEASKKIDAADLGW